jgi:hypothetical protein
VRAIALEPPETDREQLHDLARVVLVGVRAGDVQAADREEVERAGLSKGRLRFLGQ